MSKAKSHAASAKRAPPNSSPPATGHGPDSAAPTHRTPSTTTSAGEAPGRLRISRVISSRSAAIVITRKANHHGRTAPDGAPAAKSALPTHQAQALASSSAVWPARWRISSSTFTATNVVAARTSRTPANAASPRSSATPASPEASGASQASARRAATARSMPITVPRKPHIINAACARGPRPSQSLSAVPGIATPTRSNPPSTPATSALATQAASTAPAAARGLTTPSGAAPCRSCAAPSMGAPRPARRGSSTLRGATGPAGIRCLRR